MDHLEQEDGEEYADDEPTFDFSHSSGNLESDDEASISENNFQTNPPEKNKSQETISITLNQSERESSLAVETPSEQASTRKNPRKREQTPKKRSISKRKAESPIDSPEPKKKRSLFSEMREITNDPTEWGKGRRNKEKSKKNFLDCYDFF